MVLLVTKIIIHYKYKPWWGVVTNDDCGEQSDEVFGNMSLYLIACRAVWKIQCTCAFKLSQHYVHNEFVTPVSELWGRIELDWTENQNPYGE